MPQRESTGQRPRDDHPTADDWEASSLGRMELLEAGQEVRYLVHFMWSRCDKDEVNELHRRIVDVLSGRDTATTLVTLAHVAGVALMSGVEDEVKRETVLAAFRLMLRGTLDLGRVQAARSPAPKPDTPA
ncbi:MAG TPA: hypothetical protein VNO55_19875 [Polyangia bacterium]|nr:hypothetical protein [Polyangia bacterium]